MKTSSEVLDAINELERRFPVQSWRANDIDLWPTYRIRLYTNATSAFLLSDAALSWPERVRRLAERGARALWRVPLASWRDRAMNARLRPGNAALFLSDGMSFTKLGDTWFDRIVDPLMLALDERGLASLKLTPLAEAHVPRHVPSCFVQPTIDRLKLFGSGGRLEPTLPELDAFLAEAREIFGAQAPGREWLAVQAGRLDRLAHWFAGTLARSGASHAFVNTYYSLEGLALVQGARRAHVRSVDLQHGMQGPHHVAYARWADPPATGYSTLPDEFWVWGDEEAQTIDDWRGARAAHRPRVIGNLWLERWRDDRDPAVAAYVAQARAVRGAAPATAQALVSLSWGLAQAETDKLIAAAKLCGPSIAWWWRLHPVESHRRAELAARLAAHGLDGSQVGAATDLPLYALVRAADLTLAHSSTVIHEASVFGVPSVVTSDYGAELHSALVRQGVALHATSEDAIAKAVLALAARPRRATSSGAAATGLRLHTLIDSVFPRQETAGAGQEAAHA